MFVLRDDDKDDDVGDGDYGDDVIRQNRRNK